MTPHHQLDPMQRFVATPHRKVVSFHGGYLTIESNDKLLLMALCASLQVPAHAALVRSIQLLKIVVDQAATDDGPAISVIASAHLRLVLRGTNTILMHDTQRRELLAFLAPDVSYRDLVETLLPAAALDSLPRLELQTRDMDSMAL